MAGQLQLPGLRRREPAPPPRAKRDFTPAEFARALERNAFRHIGDLAFEDQELHRLVRVNEIRRDPIRLARRAALAQLMRLRAEVYRELAKQTRRRTEGRRERGENHPPVSRGAGAILSLI